MSKVLIITTVTAIFCAQSLCMEELTVKNDTLLFNFLKKDHVIVHPTDDQQEFMKIDFTPSQKNLTLTSRGEKHGYHHVYDLCNKKKVVTFPVWRSDRELIFTRVIFSKKQELFPYIGVLNKGEKFYTAKLLNLKTNELEKEIETYRTIPSLYRFGGKKTEKFIVHNRDEKSFTVYDTETKQTKLHAVNERFSNAFSLYSSDGRYIVIPVGELDYCLYDIDKDTIKYFQKSFVRLSPNDNLLLQEKNKKKLQLHYLDDGKIITLRGNEGVSEMFFTDCGTKIIYESEDRKTFYFYDIKNGTTQEYRFEEDFVISRQVANNNIVFVLKEHIVLYDIDNHSFKKMGAYYGERMYVDTKKSFFFSKKRRYKHTQDIFIYDLKNDRPWDQRTFQFSSHIGDMQYSLSPDENYLIMITQDRKDENFIQELIVYDIQNKKETFSSKYTCLGFLDGVHYKYIPACKSILFAKDKNTLCFYCYSTNTYLEKKWNEELKQFDCNDDGTIIFISTEKETVVLNSQINESNSNCLLL